MPAPEPSVSTPSNRSGGWWTRDNALVVVLVTVTAILLLLCALLIAPFFSAIAWALSLAVVAHPLHGWLACRVSSLNVSAGISVCVIGVVLVAPTLLIGRHILMEASAGVQSVQASIDSGQWREQVARNPGLTKALARVEKHVDIAARVRTIAEDLGKQIPQFLIGSVWAVIQLLLTFFVLFFFFRDRHKTLAVLRSLVPLSNKEIDEVFTRVSDTIHASIYGHLVVALIQGTLGGLMFWWLGLPGPVLWGAAMVLCSMMPILGAPIIWLPAAIALALGGDTGKAVLLTLWGVFVIGLIDNFLTPMLVGKRMRLHTVPVFFAIIGGLSLFGASGLVLGPVILALTAAILDVWRRRTSAGRAAEEAIPASSVAPVPIVPS